MTLGLLVLLLAASGMGCGGVKSQATSLGRDVVDALRSLEPEIFDIERRLADSAGVFIGRAVEQNVLARASGVWDSMLLRANEESRVIIRNVAQGVETDLNRSLQVLLQENLAVARTEGAAAADQVVQSAMLSLRRNVDPLVETMSLSLARAMREELGPVMLEVINATADSLTRRVTVLDSLLADSETGRKASRTLWGVVIGLAGVLLVGGLWLRRERIWRRKRLAYDATIRSRFGDDFTDDLFGGKGTND